MSQFENLHVTIISPERTLFHAKVEAVFVPGEKGRFEILKNHAPILSSLEAGTIVCVGDNAFEINISAGFVEVKKNKVTLCVETA